MMRAEKRRLGRAIRKRRRAYRQFVDSIQLMRASFHRAARASRFTPREFGNLREALNEGGS